MSKRVLIVIDGEKRELFGASLLSLYLRSMELESILCSTHTFRDYYVRYMPQAVVCPNALIDLSDIAERSFVFLLPSESGNGQPDQVRVNHAGSQHSTIYSDPVDRFFCWGPMMKQILLETGVWQEEQLVVTGSPATDHWLLPHRDGKPGGRLIGLTTTFRAVSNAAPPGKMNYLQWLDEAEVWGGDGTFYEPPEHAESWLFFEASFARAIGTLIRALALERSESIVIRPHPMELDSRYEYYSRFVPSRVSVDKRGTISEWLDDKSILFTYMSASSLDAVVRGIPVVSMKGLLDPDAIRKKPRHFRYSYEDMLWQMSDVRQAAEYVEAAAAGTLRPCKDEEGVREFLAQHFAFPRREPAAQQIAVEIQKVMEGGGRRRGQRGKQTPRSGLRGIKDAACRYVPLAVQGLALGRYLSGLLPGRQDIGWSYQPWRVKERRTALQCAEKILSASRQEATPWLRGKC